MEKREIKFRYRFDRGEHIEKVTGEPRYKTEIVTLEELENGSFEIYYSNYKILSRDQFTGLQDKNGKDIYEGDIVKSESDLKSIYKVVCEVRLGVGVRDSNNTWQGKIYDRDIEIIGDIHTTPNLLNNHE